MGRGTRNVYNQKPTSRYDGIILQTQKRGQELLLSVFTRQEGLLRVFVPKRCRGKQGFGALMALSCITFDAVQTPSLLVLREYECRGNPGMMQLTWDRYIYSQIFIEIVQYIFPHHEADEQAYELMVIYSQVLLYKNPRIVTIIAGWQLLALAGFYPDTAHVRLFAAGMDGRRPIYYLSDGEEPLKEPLPEVQVSQEMRTLWQTLLTYKWGQTQTLHFSAKGLAFWEDVLYSYTEQCSDKKMKTIELLEKYIDK